jgi:hypothetical protein
MSEVLRVDEPTLVREKVAVDEYLLDRPEMRILADVELEVRNEESNQVRVDELLLLGARDHPLKYQRIGGRVRRGGRTGW